MIWITEHRALLMNWKCSFDMKMVVYSTHKHTPEKPRLRIIIFLTRDVTPDEYGAVSRMLASDIGIELFDDSTL